MDSAVLNVYPPDLEAVRNPGMTLCSLVLVWMMESIRSSRVRSFATEGLLQRNRKEGTGIEGDDNITGLG